MPATPIGVIELLKRYYIESDLKNCVVVGSRRLVGSRISMMLVEQGRANVTVCHK
jgi:methylenetetrahydrofolate dehydrogenase (NADP+)/methenyltetrahydrofolate cyclohydrolase